MTRSPILTCLLCVALAFGVPPQVLAQAAPDATASPAEPPARPATDSSVRLRVAVVPVEPLVIEEGEGIYDGLAVALWQVVAQRAGLTYDYVQADKESVPGMLRRGEVDIWLAATPKTGSRDTTAHSPIYFTSSMAVARRGGNSVVNVVKGLFQPAFFGVIVGLSILLLIVGTIIYFLERKSNGDEFGGPVHEGIGAGFWWAGVTLTTIGYGDKAPVTLGGRIVAMLWMLVGLAVSATLTATIVALATSGGAALKLPDDLRGERNVAVAGSGVAPFLDRLGVEYEAVDALEAGIERVEREEADYLVGTRMELEYYLDNRSSDLSVQVSRLVPSYYAIAFRADLPEADRISTLVANVTGSAVWPKWLDQYVPAEGQ